MVAKNSTENKSSAKKEYTWKLHPVFKRQILSLQPIVTYFNNSLGEASLHLANIFGNLAEIMVRNKAGSLKIFI